MNRWLSCSRLEPETRLRLFCFPYAGGGAALFRTWHADMPRGIQVCPVLLPGHESRLRELPFSRLSPLVQALLPILRPHLEIPFAFFGHSLGALISFELARELRQEGRTPVLLFVSGHRAPQIPDRHLPIHRLPTAAFLEALRRLGGTPAEILDHAEFMELMLPVLRADFAVAETYVYEPREPLGLSISAFGGLEDRVTSLEDLAAWQAQTCGPFRLRMVPGNHFFLDTARAMLLQSISEDLNDLLGQGDRLS